MPLTQVTHSGIQDGTITDADINASAAISGSKVSPDFGSQNTTTTGTTTAASFIPTSSTVPTNGVYLPGANTLGLSTNSVNRITVNSNGQVGINTANPQYPLDVNGNIRSTNQIYSTVATGTAPFVVSSTTKVSNLNVDSLDGFDSSTFFGLNPQTITVGGDANTWYPVAFPRLWGTPTTYYITKEVHNYQYWDGSLIFIYMCHTNGWGTWNGFDKIIMNTYSSRQFIGAIYGSPQNNGSTVIYLLGGGRNYLISIQPSLGASATVYTSTTVIDGGTYAPITSAQTVATGWEP